METAYRRMRIAYAFGEDNKTITIGHIALDEVVVYGVHIAQRYKTIPFEYLPDNGITAYFLI